MELKLEIRTPLSPYVKEILETFFLGISFLLSDLVRTRFDLNPKQEWIQAHVAQTMNL